MSLKIDFFFHLLSTSESHLGLSFMYKLKRILFSFQFHSFHVKCLYSWYKKCTIHQIISIIHWNNHSHIHIYQLQRTTIKFHKTLSNHSLLDQQSPTTKHITMNTQKDLFNKNPPKEKIRHNKKNNQRKTKP